MKQITLFGLLVILVLKSINSFSQTNTFPLSGNVGIGTATPNTKLDVYGNLTLGDGTNNFNAFIKGVLNTSFNWDIKNLSSGFQILSAKGGAASFNIDFDGKVGVGTTNPLTKLVLGGTGDPNPNPGTERDYAAGALSWQTDAILLGSIKMVQASGYWCDDADMVFMTNQGSSLGMSEKVRIKDNGNVGIGTIAPLEKLNIAGNLFLDVPVPGNRSIKFAHLSYPESWSGIQGRTTSEGSNVTELGFFTGYGISSEKMTIKHTGSVGVNTITPDAKFEAGGDVLVGDGYQDRLYFYNISDNVFGIQTLIDGLLIGDYPYAEGANRLILQPKGGNVGIGTANPGNYKLNVSGKIRADEVVVNTTGADFVFAPEYKLATLSEVESFIKENNHLPGITSADEMKENGINVSEMQTKLLQKLEEMTLYIIEQDKKNELQSREIELLKQDIEILNMQNK